MGASIGAQAWWLLTSTVHTVLEAHTCKTGTTRMSFFFHRSDQGVTRHVSDRMQCVPLYCSHLEAIQYVTRHNVAQRTTRASFFDLLSHHTKCSTQKIVPVQNVCTGSYHVHKYKHKCHKKRRARRLNYQGHT